MPKPKILEQDPWLQPFEGDINYRVDLSKKIHADIVSEHHSLSEYASAYQYFGLHPTETGWVFREWAPNASAIYLVGEFNNWETDDEYACSKNEKGEWEITLAQNRLKHGDLYKLLIKWPGGEDFRLPSYATRVMQNDETLVFDAQVWEPDSEFVWTDDLHQTSNESPLIYEAHIGMSSEQEKVSSYNEFKVNILPRIKALGYNTIQFMAIQEHPYYGSFGYHVSNYFAVSSRCGTPEELKDLINTAHSMGINVIMDIVHSHSVKNVQEGLSLFDGTDYIYFHGGEKGNHPAWDSRLFDYNKPQTRQFLLSNCKYWIEEFHFDGYRFDGVTSMIYLDHGLGKDFGQYADYFGGVADMDAIVYLTLANQLIHELKPNAISIAEEMSGYPGLAGDIADGGIGFDYRLSMGVPDFWIKMIKEMGDENWNVDQIYHELTQHRVEEKVISYAESHDQALVGDKTIIFRLADKDMYDFMAIHTDSLIVDRAIVLHKMIRLITSATSNGGYLNFMGNEFGHPEWIDFPRVGNDFSYQYARRQWSLADHPDLKYKFLNLFDEAMIHLIDSEKILNLPIWKAFGNSNDQVVAFGRGDYLFVFNFNPTQSFTDYGIPVGPGKYKPILSTDENRFGGFDRTDLNYTYYAQSMAFQKDQFQLLLYLPARTAMVLKRQIIRSVH